MIVHDAPPTKAGDTEAPGKARPWFHRVFLVIALLGSGLPSLLPGIFKLVETHEFIAALVTIAEGFRQSPPVILLCVFSIVSYFAIQRHPRHSLIAYICYAFVFLVVGGLLAWKMPNDSRAASGETVLQQSTPSANPEPLSKSALQPPPSGLQSGESPVAAPLPQEQTATAQPTPRHGGVYLDIVDLTLRGELQHALARKGIATTSNPDNAAATLQASYDVTKRFTGGFQLRISATLLGPNDAVLGYWENQPERMPLANEEPDTINNVMHIFVASDPSLDSKLLNKLLDKGDTGTP
jgi:hypothetical protein